tara:strand:+ start:254 stop:424 length:171 start_codon:yes stop_codon:yes gene_type:complete
MTQKLNDVIASMDLRLLINRRSREIKSEKDTAVNEQANMAEAETRICRIMSTHHPG